MPELPEVETVRRGLAPALEGRRLVRVVNNRSDLRFPLPDRFSARLSGRTVECLERRAKYLVARLDGGESLIMHLGMTGRFTDQCGSTREKLADYVYGEGSDPRHDHVVFETEDGNRIVYNDVRRFGFMLLLDTQARDSHPLFRELGPEPLSADFTPEYLAARARGKKVNLKVFLMDQKVVAGLGNIYVSEALHRAALSPERAARTLSDAKARATGRAERLTASVKAVLEEAIAAGGSTLRDYRLADGTRGGFQEKFFAYDRGGEVCLRPECGGTVRRVVHAGRATYYCPRCQR